MATDTVLVTGATGTVGSELAAILGDDSVRLRVASRDPGRAADHLGLDAEYVPFDLRDASTHRRALTGVDRLFLLRPPDVTRVGATVAPFVDAAVDAGVDQIAFLSVLGAENNPLLPHRRIERVLSRADVDTTFLRASYFMQNLVEVHGRDIRERNEVFVPAGDGAVSLVDAHDVAAVAAAALTEGGHRNRAYDVTGPEALDFYEIADVLSTVLGRRVTYPNPSIPAFAHRMRKRGHSFGFVAVMVGIYTAARLGFSDRVTGDVERVLCRPPIPFGDFASDYADRLSSSATGTARVPGTGLESTDP
jgi:uncharacterized protein YbjT (DUF2867 family)